MKEEKEERGLPFSFREFRLWLDSRPGKYFLGELLEERIDKLREMNEETSLDLAQTNIYRGSISELRWLLTMPDTILSELEERENARSTRSRSG